MAQPQRVRNDLHRAAIRRDGNKVETLMRDNPDLIALQDNHGKTPLYYAAERAILENICLEMIGLTDNATLNSLFLPQATPSLLHQFARLGYIRCTNAILARTAERINHMDLDKQTPLHWCAKANLTLEEHHGIIKRLLETPGVNPNLMDQEGNKAGDLYNRNPCLLYDNPQVQKHQIQQLFNRE